MNETDNYNIYNDDFAVFLLPSEVLEHIFGFLDAQSFCISRQVCKAWNEVIKSMQRKKSVWRHFCISEIPKNVLEEILWFKSDKLSDFDWINIYKKWFFSKMILKSPCWKKKIHAFCANPVTCVRISGSWIITGHNNGLLSIWNMLTGDLCQSFMCHLKVITDMALVDLLNLGSYYGSEELPWAHHHIITISKDRYIHVLSLLEPMISTDSDIHINYHTDDLNQIRVFDDNFAVSCRDNTVTLWNMKVQMMPYFHLKVSLLRKIMGPIDYVLCLGLWHDQVQCISHGGKLRQFCPVEKEWRSDWRFTLAYSADAGIGANSAFLFRQNAALVVSDHGTIVVSVGGGLPTHCHLWPKLGTAIVTVAFHGTILALGGENGKLFLYHVPHEERLPHRDLTRPDSVLSLSEASIIAVDIAYHRDAPVVAACSSDNVYVVKWYRREAERLKKRDLCEWVAGHL